MHRAFTGIGAANIKTQYPCGENNSLGIFMNVKILGEINIDAGEIAISYWPLALSLSIVTHAKLFKKR